MNHEHYLLCAKNGEPIAIFVDWARAERCQQPGDYLLVRKDPTLSAALVRELTTLTASTDGGIR